MAKTRSYAKLFGESREALLDLVASAVETYHRQRGALEQNLPNALHDDEVDESDKSGKSDKGDQGDFLHDFLHLNVDYLNRLARLGSNYSIVGARALERLYEWAQPPAVENHLKDVAGRSVFFSFTVSNRSGRPAKLSCACSRFSDGRRSVSLEPKFRFFRRTEQQAKKTPPATSVDAKRAGGKRELETTTATKIPPGETWRVMVELTVARTMALGVEYQGSVVAKVGGHDECEHVVVVQRERA